MKNTTTLLTLLPPLRSHCSRHRHPEFRGIHREQHRHRLHRRIRRQRRRRRSSQTVAAGVLGLGTPDISPWTGWAGGWDTYTAWDGRGNVAQTDYNAGATQSILFTPAAGIGVKLQSFDLDAFAGAGASSINWTVTGPGSGTLASGNWTKTTAGGRDVITLPAAAVGQPGEAVTLSFTRVSGGSSYFAIDNLTFDQVPEPSSTMLGGLALGAAAMRRRRNRA